VINNGQTTQRDRLLLERRRVMTKSSIPEPGIQSRCLKVREERSEERTKRERERGRRKEKPEEGRYSFSLLTDRQLLVLLWSHFFGKGVNIVCGTFQRGFGE
jgi:hypothetical protein